MTDHADTIRRDPTYEELTAKCGVLLAERQQAIDALRAVHDFNCGCDHPGDLSYCVAHPIAEFRALVSLGETE